MIFTVFSFLFDFPCLKEYSHRCINPSFFYEIKRPLLSLEGSSNGYTGFLYAEPVNIHAFMLRYGIKDTSYFSETSFSFKISTKFHAGFGVGIEKKEVYGFSQGTFFKVGIGGEPRRNIRFGTYILQGKGAKKLMAGGAYQYEIKKRKINAFLAMGASNGKFKTDIYLIIPLAKNLNIRGGIGIIGDTVDGSFGFSVFSQRIENTDVFLDYELLFPSITHLLSIGVRLGDALKKEKEIKRRKQEVRALQLREEALRKEIENLKRLKKEIEDLKIEIEKEKLSLEERRREAMEALKKLEGIRIQEEKEWLRIIAGERAIHFASGSAEIPFPEGYKVLVKIGRFLKTYPGKRIIIEGHTDNVPIGPKLKSKYPDNQALSEARAATIKRYFVEVEEIPENLIQAVGYGETRPIASNETEEGRALNRRVEIKIIKE